MKTLTPDDLLRRPYLEKVAALLDRHPDLAAAGFARALLRHVALASSVHRGVERPFDHSSAYGQWGGVMVELVQQRRDVGGVIQRIHIHCIELGDGPGHV